MVAFASLGGNGAYIGKVFEDALGENFSLSMKQSGVHFDTAPTQDGAPTARCIIIVTPDAERTLNTYLGACMELSPRDIDPDIIQSSQVTYMEGYLFDRPAAKEAFFKAAELAHAAGRKVSLSLSDPFCVDRFRDEFLHLLEGHIDILFANEEEIKSLYQVEEFDDALQFVRGHCEVAALTRGDKGSVVVSGEEIHVIDAHPVTSMVDTTGAGDAYAAGFLYGITHHLDLHDAAHIGGVAAAEVINHMGARPAEPLDKLIETTLNIKI
jgi:sugar/nucleoside kinase (ribokinase family)